MSETSELPKPTVLYHASENRHIDSFHPRAEKIRDPEEGPVVFATPDAAFASMFIVRTDDSWTKIGRFRGVYYTVISDKDRFERMDKGGSIYSFYSDTFETDPNRGMGEKEWSSKVPVKPISKTDYNSGLDAMINYGVQVFFVDTDTFKKINESKDRGESILRNMESENQKRGRNIKEIPPPSKD